MSSVIKVEGLSKRYWLGQSRGRSRTLREDITHWIAAPFRRLGARRSGPDTAARESEEFWALKDVSFEVEQGDVIGIIGRNGAGKSTLLKLLSRITEPTEGRIEIAGRIASLLEVGTGFHSELTGRENIFLNGAILGMTRAEIRRKFDEIVAFAEVDKFLDTPVKRYSSGMYVRLAFAVAAHLEPEILIVDEVLAVGDAQFQQKCLGKMRDVSNNEGRTVLFVSHQMGTIRQLCSKGILLTGGRLTKLGPTNAVIDEYLAASLGGRTSGFSAGALSRDKDIAVHASWTCKANGEAASYFVHTEPVNVHVQCQVNRWVPNAELRLVVGDARGRRVFTSDVNLTPPPDGTTGTIEAIATIPAVCLRPEAYFVTLATFVNNQLIIDLVNDGFSFSVQDGGSKYAASEGMDYGCVFVPCQWSVGYSTEPLTSSAASSNV